MENETCLRGLEQRTYTDTKEELRRNKLKAVMKHIADKTMLPYAVICASTDGSWTPFVKTILQLVAKSNPALGQALDFIYDECKDGWNNRLRACTILLGVIVAHCNELQTYSDLLCSIAWTLWQSGETVELSIPDMTGITELMPIQRYFDIGDEALCYASADAAIMDFAV